MNSINRTAKFNEWLADLKDLKARAKVIIRMRQAAQGNFGDIKTISDGVSEMRIHFGPGYRIYYARDGRAVYLLLIGGNKSTQKRDIKTAISMWKQIQEEQP
ncbi:type II toxin-antitoxin system RelE/ParE family toxin [Pollutimonas thiosulfatoxidans]|uniref:Addiction module antitoxin RelB n=1 Tax=Pollutimonas thiosulfatoxidans TaxID=2028345 RepID=A0A410G988_9BURK|nr:type II toxin-antitoxin system RelE/ParE family toxin [Pollutimonas thiosulfatoxidans]MBF6615241.1 type II toxin-antitoxin system RelE/ParE family toxin [Candidimonas sp.]QAA92884.1 addiction module antitoxin RelB [Pollutimonas thiosulfatoxidans]